MRQIAGALLTEIRRWRGCDAVVVGAAAPAAAAAMTLAERGLSVCLVDAGGLVAADAPDGHRLRTKARALVGGQHVQARCGAYGPRTRRLFVDDRANPYTTERGRPFNWFRGRQVGGRLHLWLRVCPRMTAPELAGWPVTVDELAPYYERVEQLFAVAPTEPTPAEEHLAAAVAEHRPQWTFMRAAIAAPEPGPLPRAVAAAPGDRAADAPRRLRRPARGHRRGRARDRRVRRRHRHRADGGDPRGDGRARRRRDRDAAADARPPRRRTRTASETRPGCSDGASPTTCSSRSAARTRRLPAPAAPKSGSGSPSRRAGGSSSREPSAAWTGSPSPPAARCARTPTTGSRSDPRVRDAWGVPAAHIRCVHGPADLELVAEEIATLHDVAGLAGLRPRRARSAFEALALRLASRKLQSRDGLLVPGGAIHETGGAGIGTDPEASVLDADHRCWDAPNVLVVDGRSCRRAGTTSRRH